jgi:hypothetical protein
MKRGEARLCKRAVDVRSGRLASSLAATQQNVEIVRDCGGRRRRVVQDPRLELPVEQERVERVVDSVVACLGA